MESKILQSAVEISNQRDRDSLECSIVTTIAELVPVAEVSVLKIINKDRLDKIEMAVCLTVVPDEHGNDNYVWSESSQIISVDHDVKKGLESIAVSTHRTSEGGTHILLPVICDGKIVGAISIKSNQDIIDFLPIIEGFVKIYNNYVIIFNESERDKLTGLYNRRTFDNKLKRLFNEKNIRRAQYLESEKIPERRISLSDKFVWLVICDIDHFKLVNDNYGHIFGDEVLLTLSQMMKECFRNSDLKFRVGGEEFVIILEPSTFEESKQIIESFRKTIVDHEFPQVGTVTMSFGFAKITEKDFPSVILERADKALYYAKEHGRNCVYNYEMLVEEGELSPPKKSSDIDLF